jgi:iron-sulfur cluster assembly protein
MDNIVTIGSTPGEGASAPAPQAPVQGVHVTEKAVARIRIAMAKEDISPEEGGLRLGVTGGGCSGMSYVMKVETHPHDRDQVFEFDGVRVFIDPKSFIYLNGMTLDFEETLIRQGFNFLNPNATRSCSCGTSFSA